MTTISLKSGDKAPEFNSVDQNGAQIKLSDLKGKKLILYFYPKDNTSGCTAEACSLRDGYEKLSNHGYVVVGVSPDSEKSHQNFIKKFDLPFKLIADTNQEVSTLYGVWGEKKMYGRSYMGILRATFLIDEKGIISHVISKVNTGDHVNQIIEIIEKS